MDDDIPYLLLTPGPLTTSKTVKQVMLQDFCTWDDDYNNIVSQIRRRVVGLATERTDDFTCVLMQGSGSFSVEAVLGSVVPPDGRVLVANNGAYGARMAKICQCLGMACTSIQLPEDQPASPQRIEQELKTGRFSHLALVHCETSTGLLNPISEAGRVARQYGATFIVDAMSSFGGMPMSMEQIHADYLISSPNKCLQGVPGFGLVVARRSDLEKCEGRARSHSLDLFGQWAEMEKNNGKWRFTSPTHTVRAFAQALAELDLEGGIPARHARYRENHQALVEGLSRLGFKTLVSAEYQSPFITAFHYPRDSRFDFQQLYDELKARRFVIYPGKVSQAPTFRIGAIGHVFPEDMRELAGCVEEVASRHGWEI